MHKQFRHGTFETNSSSSHSFVLDITDEVNLQQIDITSQHNYDPDEKTYTSYGGDFHWGYDELTTWSEKLDYLVQAAEYSEYNQANLAAAFLYRTGVALIQNPSGGIDHQSVGIVDDVFGSQESILSMIFGNGSSIKIDNDNH